MNNEKEIKQVEKATDEAADQPQADEGEGELKITVRKLDMPVRPRGVLAE